MHRTTSDLAHALSVDGLRSTVNVIRGPLHDLEVTCSDSRIKSMCFVCLAVVNPNTISSQQVCHCAAHIYVLTSLGLINVKAAGVKGLQGI